MPTQTKSVQPGRFYKTVELAEITGIPDRTLRSMIDDGRLPYHLIGNQNGRRILGQDFLDWKKAARRVNRG